MEAAALFERVLRVSFLRLEFRFSARQKAGYGLHAIALMKLLDMLAQLLSINSKSSKQGDKDPRYDFHEIIRLRTVLEMKKS